MAQERLSPPSKEHSKSRDWLNTSVIKNAIEDHRNLPLTPELVNDTWTTFWREGGKRIGHTFNVPGCNCTSDELRELRSLNGGVLLIPDEVYTPEGLILLGKMFPEITSQVVRDNTSIINETDKGGCIVIDMGIEPPHMPVSETEALEYAKKIKRTGEHPQRFATYLIGSQFSNLLTRKYFDDNGTSSFLPGSRWKFDDRILLVRRGSVKKGNIVADVGNGDTALKSYGVRTECTISSDQRKA